MCSAGERRLHLSCAFRASCAVSGEQSQFKSGFPLESFRWLDMMREMHHAKYAASVFFSLILKETCGMLPHQC